MSATKTYLITGAAGFIGTNLCLRLLNDTTNTNIHIWAIDNCITSPPLAVTDPRLQFICCNVVTDMHIFESLPRIDEIYHLASIASPPKYKQFPIETLDVNVIGTRNMLELAARHSAKLLLTSTSEVYGDPKEHPQKESYYGNVNIVGERSCYDESKRCAETYVYEYGKRYRTTNFKICRIFNTYGPHMDIDDGRVITNFIQCILDKRPVTIYGDGAQTRSFCYIEDTLDGLQALMASDETGPLNIGNPHTEFTIQKLVDIFVEQIGVDVPISYEPRTENDPAVRRPDISLAKKKLGFDPKWSLEHGIRETFAHFSKNRK